MSMCYSIVLLLVHLPYTQPTKAVCPT